MGSPVTSLGKVHVLAPKHTLDGNGWKVFKKDYSPTQQALEPEAQQ